MSNDTQKRSSLTLWTVGASTFPTPILLLCPHHCYYTPTISSNVLCGLSDDEIYECE